MSDPTAPTAPEPQVREWKQREGRPSSRWEASCCRLLSFRMVRTARRAQVILARHVNDHHHMNVTAARVLVRPAVRCPRCVDAGLAHGEVGIGWEGEPCGHCHGIGYVPGEPKAVG